MEPMVGIEPTTYGLRNRCSTAELHWLFTLKQTKRRLFCLGPNEWQVNSPFLTAADGSGPKRGTVPERVCGVFSRRVRFIQSAQRRRVQSRARNPRRVQ